MKRKDTHINGPDDLNKHLQSTSFATWFALGAISLLLIGLFVWACLFKMEIKLTGDATIHNGVATLVVEEDKVDKIKEGQLVYIGGEKGEISSLVDGRPPVASHFNLADGDYTYTVILEEKRPISFVFGN